MPINFHCHTPLDGFTEENLANRERAARDMLKVCRQYLEEAPNPFRKNALNKVIEYLELIAVEANRVRIQKQQDPLLDSEEDRYIALQEDLRTQPENSTLENECSNLLASLRSRRIYAGSLRGDVTSTELRLRSMAAKEMHEYLTIIVGMPNNDCLRPPAVELSEQTNLYSGTMTIRAEKKAAFSSFAANQWKELRTKSTDPVSDDLLAKLALDWDKQGWKPTRDFLPRSVIDSIAHYNKHHPTKAIKTFSGLIQAFRIKKVNSGFLRIRNNNKAATLQPLRRWLSYNAGR